MQGDKFTFWNYALVYFTTALPFFVSGIIISLAISETIDRVNRVYFFDLLGAAGGCLLLLPLLEWLGGPSTVLSLGGLLRGRGRNLVQHGRVGGGARRQRRAGPGAGRLPDVQLPAPRHRTAARQGTALPGRVLRQVEQLFAHRDRQVQRSAAQHDRDRRRRLHRDLRIRHRPPHSQRKARCHRAGLRAALRRPARAPRR